MSKKVTKAKSTAPAENKHEAPVSSKKKSKQASNGEVKPAKEMKQELDALDDLFASAKRKPVADAKVSRTLPIFPPLHPQHRIITLHK